MRKVYNIVVIKNEYAHVPNFSFLMYRKCITDHTYLLSDSAAAIRLWSGT